MAARRLGYLAFAAGRSAGAGRADVRRHARSRGRVAARPPSAPHAPADRVRVARLRARGRGGASRPRLDAAAPDARKLRRLARREARVWHGADGYVTITAALAADLTARLGRRERLAVVPDGARISPAR